MSHSALLESVVLFLKEQVAPVANQMDADAGVLQAALQGLGDRHLLALKVPRDWGGADLHPILFHQFQEQLARYSGALAFLQTQHQSAGASIAKSQNEALKREYLPLMGTGERLVGIGFSHLRRETNPPLKATPVDGGYRLQGTIPWLTGYGFFEEVLIAGLLPDGKAVYGIVPFESRTGIQLSEPLALAAMMATNTVSAEVSNWIVPQERVVAVQPAKAIHISDRANVLNHSAFALGCAQAGLDVVEQVRRAKPFLAIGSAQVALTEELAQCRMAMYGAQDADFEKRLQVRSHAIDLAVRCAHAAVIVSSGVANSLQHPAQRIYREALAFTVAGQTIAVLEASLQQVAQKNPPH